MKVQTFRIIPYLVNNNSPNSYNQLYNINYSCDSVTFSSKSVKKDFSLNEEQLYNLEQDIKETCKKLGFKEQDGKEFQQQIFTAYGTERKYHGLGHINNMLNWLNKFLEYNGNDIDVLLLKFAIFTHDYYNGIANDVEKSAEFGEDTLKKSSLYCQEKSDKLRKMILNTKHNLPLDTNSSLEEKILVDLDLAILGSSANEYKKYSDNIRKEYSQYADNIFAQGRINVLKSFIDRDKIYNTEFFIKKYEKQARANINDEIARLKENIK